MTAQDRQAQPIEAGVLSFIQKHDLVRGQHCLLVAVSGGQDSVCLLHLLDTLKARLGITLHVAHLNHQLRGADSEADAQYVANLAEQMGIPATIERRDVKAYQAKWRLSPEEAAREVRYTFLSEVARSLSTDRVAVAHTGDDHVETVLMHLIRGSGTKGLRGLQPTSLWRSEQSRLVVVRPLLEVSREKTGDYCRARELMPRIDASNLSLSPFRNRVRLELLPLLKSYNPGIAGALLRTSRIAAEVTDYLDKECRRVWEGVVERRGEAFLLRKAAFIALPAALQWHLLRLVIEEILSDLKDIESRHIEQIMAFLTGPAGRKLNLPDGLTFAADYDHYVLGLDSTSFCPLPSLEGEVALKVPGETNLPGWRVTATLSGREQGKETSDDFAADLDFAKTGAKLVVRARQPGDRFYPLGLGGVKKLGRFMLDARIPRSWRERVPVVVSPEQIVWVVGWRIDDRVKIDGSTRSILRVEFKAMTS
ncbi:MAG: tRNA lysidine(34) synthetase TilS [Chloroflexi bacterium]|nr:tRNA lysidine(34) synthetase TilS [Chloroflexota bacterium]